MAYRVWCVINPPSRAIHHEVVSPAQGAVLINSMAALQLHDPNVDANAFGLETLVNGEWEEWYSEEGEDVDEAFAHLLDSSG